MTPLHVWAAICDAPVIGRVGHRRTHEGGQAHPLGHAPAWVTPRGCDLGALHAAHSAHVVVDRRGEHRECAVSSARVLKPRRRRRRVADVIQIRRSA
jgi:hypothetical protein